MGHVLQTVLYKHVESFASNLKWVGMGKYLHARFQSSYTLSMLKLGTCATL
jgi:hypothetical protein